MKHLSVTEKVLLSIASLSASAIVLYLLLKKYQSLVDRSQPNIDGFEERSTYTSLQSSTICDEQPELDPEPYKGPQKSAVYTSSSSSIEGFQEGLELDDFTKPFKQIGDFFKMLGTLGQRMERFGRSFVEFGEGAFKLLTNLSQIAIITVEDVFTLAADSFTCFIGFLSNFRKCIVFWVLDFFLHLCKALFITFPVYIINVLSGFDFQPVIDMIVNEILSPIDDLIYGLIGYHFMHFPDWVIRDCYTCNLMSDLYKIGDDFGPDGIMAHLFWEPISLFIQGGQDFIQLFDPL